MVEAARVPTLLLGGPVIACCARICYSSLFLLHLPANALMPMALACIGHMLARVLEPYWLPSIQWVSTLSKLAGLPSYRMALNTGTPGWQPTRQAELVVGFGVQNPCRKT
jgi:hypothetical protein